MRRPNNIRSAAAHKVEPCAQNPVDFVGFDFDGTLISSDVNVEASRRWFAYFSEVLNDPSVAVLSFDAHADAVIDVMRRVNSKCRGSEPSPERLLAEAREHYRSIFLEIISNNNQGIINIGVGRALVALQKEGVRTALISTTPERIVEPALAILSLREDFSVVLAGPQHLMLDKKFLLERFLKEYGALLCYVGDSDEDERACASLSIPFIRLDKDSFRFSFLLRAP
jgi:phosphoglycolate phosphatase-like HAD superfamily hydrolase